MSEARATQSAHVGWHCALARGAQALANALAEALAGGREADAVARELQSAVEAAELRDNQRARRLLQLAARLDPGNARRYEDRRSSLQEEGSP